MEEIKLLREILGITQEELAAKIGVSRNTIGNYEKGGVIPPAKKKLLLEMLDIAQKKTTNNRSVYNSGSGGINGPTITGDHNTVMDDKDLKILLLQKEIEHLNVRLQEKENMIQALLKK